MENLGDQVLAEVKRGGGILQAADQLIEALEKQRMAFIGDLLGFAKGDQDAAQVGEQLEMMVEVGAGHGIPVSQKRARDYSRCALCRGNAVSALCQMPAAGLPG